MKDPAVLWYWNDWSGGTITLSRHLKGCYMDLLHAQFNAGHLSLDEIKTVLGSDFGSTWSTLQKKFKQDDKGLYYNERLVTESDKRKNFTKSRRENAKGEKHMPEHMEIENEDVNKNIIKTENIEERKIKFIESSTELIKTDNIHELIKFFDYWTEKNHSGKKMRFEMEKVFDVKRRFSTWQSNNKKWNDGKQTSTNDRQQRVDSVKDLNGLSIAILEDHASKNGNRSF
jgi:hypothetical protein